MTRVLLCLQTRHGNQQGIFDAASDNGPCGTCRAASGLMLHGALTSKRKPFPGGVAELGRGLLCVWLKLRFHMQNAPCAVAPGCVRLCSLLQWLRGEWWRRATASRPSWGRSERDSLIFAVPVQPEVVAQRDTEVSSQANVKEAGRALAPQSMHCGA